MPPKKGSKKGKAVKAGKVTSSPVPEDTELANGGEIVESQDKEKSTSKKTPKRGKAVKTSSSPTSEDTGLANGDQIDSQDKDDQNDAKEASPPKRRKVASKKETTVPEEEKNEASLRKRKTAIRDTNKTAEPPTTAKGTRSRPQTSQTPTKTSPAKNSKGKAKAKSMTKKKSEKQGTLYEVQSILKSREKKGKKEYLVRWTGYKAADDSWIPEKDLQCPKILEEFNKGLSSKEE